MPLVAVASRLTILSILLLSGLFLPQPASTLAPAGASAVVISQVYSGGGSTGSTYKCDFVELFNRSSNAVALTGWSLQWYLSEWTPIKFTSGSIPPGAYFLVAPSTCSGSGTQPLPPVDYVGSVALSTAKGQVALVKNQVIITGVADADVLDFVGFGATGASEGSPAPALTVTTAAQRANGGCSDTDNNSIDFSAQTPLARNTASPTRVCSDPLAVRIAFFDARSDGSRVHVAWETVDEIDALAFELYDGPSVDGPWRLVSPSPIPAHAPGSTQGSRYDVDLQLSAPSPWFRLESIELSGIRESFGPVLVRTAEPDAVRLSQLAAQPASPVAVPAQVASWVLMLLVPAAACAAHKRYRR